MFDNVKSVWCCIVSTLNVVLSTVVRQECILYSEAKSWFWGYAPKIYHSQMSLESTSR